jgi:hypothetical protein
MAELREVSHGMTLSFEGLRILGLFAVFLKQHLALFS